MSAADDLARLRAQRQQLTKRRESLCHDLMRVVTHSIQRGQFDALNRGVLLELYDGLSELAPELAQVTAQLEAAARQVEEEKRAAEAAARDEARRRALEAAADELAGPVAILRERGVLP